MVNFDLHLRFECAEFNRLEIQPRGNDRAVLAIGALDKQRDLPVECEFELTRTQIQALLTWASKSQ